ncbi:MAG: FecR family protein [Niastella sp.]|uniref:FecR family protein n=1 Tax=Niastella sp. TaxID=1869183 RepID=UPI00389A66E5
MENEHDHFNDELPFAFNKPERDEALKDKSRQDLLSNIAQTRPSGKWRKKSAWLSVITACFLLVGMLMIFNRKRSAPPTAIQTGDFQRTILLPDSSEILLNRYSEIRANLIGWSNSKREVWLTGEAFFKINKVKTTSGRYNNFIVHTAKGDIEVLGTSFNVQADSSFFSTALHTGSIKAHIGKEAVISLVPGQVLIVQGNHIYRKEVNVQLYSAWKDGEFHFDHTSLTEVIALIEKYYKLKVKLAANLPVAERKLSGNIAVKDSSGLFNALRVIMGLTVLQQGDSLIISK